MIILVFGLPGSGKSWFARQLAKAMKADYVSSDALRMGMFTSRKYTDKEKSSVYSRMLLLANNHIQQNKNLVLDATFYKRRFRNAFTRLPAKVIPIEIVADEALIKERISKRRADSEADFAVYAHIKSDWEPMQEPHLILQSGTGNLNAMIQTAIKSFSPDYDPSANQ